jgi:hypothetical protein
MWNIIYSIKSKPKLFRVWVSKTSFFLATCFLISIKVCLRQQIEKITPLSDSEFDYILSHFTSKKLKKHQFLIQENDAVPNDF